ncbi:hypothetical protein DRQ25_17105, partial [Candidatus Fermentibacteria bacterium]
YGGVEGKQRWSLEVIHENLLDFQDEPFASGFSRSVDVWNVNMNVNTAPIEPPVAEPDRYSTEANAETYVQILYSRPYPYTDFFKADGNNFIVKLRGVVYSNIPYPDLNLYKGEHRDQSPTWFGNLVEYRNVYFALKATAVDILDNPVPFVVGINAVESAGVNVQVVTPEAFNGEPEPPDHEPTFYGFSNRGSKAQAGFISIVVTFETADQYDLRVERWTSDADDNRVVDACTWRKIISRGISINGDPYTLLNLKKQHTLMELRFEASDNIQGNVQQISALCHSKLRWWWAGGPGWEAPKETGNPAWVVLDILTGYSIQNHKTIAPSYTSDIGWVKDAQIDFDAFVALAGLCDEVVQYENYNGDTVNRPRYECNMILASNAPIIETCQSILSMCRAQLTLNQAGQVSVLIDSHKGSPPIPRQLFTPQNSWGFSGSRIFQETPHAFNVSFTSPELGFNVGTVIVYRPGYGRVADVDILAAELFEELPTYGITNWHQASLYGQYMLAQGILRSETFTLNCDVENLVVTRGDLVEIQHDVPLLGGVACLVQTDVVTPGIVYVGQILSTFAAPVGYTHRAADGTITHGDVDLVGEGQDWVTISDNVLTILQGELLVIGTKKAIGFEEQVTDPYLITSIIPKQELTAEITLVRYDADVYKDDWGSFVTWSPSFGSAPGEDTSLYIDEDTLRGVAGWKVVETLPVSTTQLYWDVGPDALTAQSCANIWITFHKDGGAPIDLITLDGHIREWLHEYDALNVAGLYGTGTYTITPVSNLGYRGKSAFVRVGQAKKVLAPPNNPRDFFTPVISLPGYTRFVFDYFFWDTGGGYPVFDWADFEDMSHFIISKGIEGSIEPSEILTTLPWTATKIYQTGALETDLNYSDFFVYEDASPHELFFQTVDTTGNISEYYQFTYTPEVPYTNDPAIWVIQDAVDTKVEWTVLAQDDIDYVTIYFNSDILAADPSAPDTVVLGTADGLTSSMIIQP